MRLLPVLLFALSAAPAIAAESKPAAPVYLDVYPFAAPVVSEGRLVNYVFVTLRLNAAPGSDGGALKRLEPALRDAMVRAAHRTSFDLAGDPTRIDTARISAVALAEGRRLAGATTFTSAEVRKQTPQRQRVSMPPPRR